MAALGLLIAAPLSASPDTFIDFVEEPIGVSEDHLFLLRVSTDNLGYYEASRVEVYFVQIDWETGAETTLVVDRFVKSMDYDENGEAQGYSIKRDEGLKPRSPYLVMTERGGIPWIAAHRLWKLSAPPVVSDQPDWITVQHGGSHRISRDAIQDGLEKQKAFFVANIADHPRSSSMTTRQHFEERTISAAQCASDGIYDYWVPGRSTLPLLMRVRCAFDDDSEQTSLIVQLRPTPIADFQLP
ncbi:hypothetical protein AUC45_10335 [Erythrobacter sp. YT30]|nr:hypothetical protein AUC45_10335 [Erythrobacter sp. YT30]